MYLFKNFNLTLRFWRALTIKLIKLINLEAPPGQSPLSTWRQLALKTRAHVTPPLPWVAGKSLIGLITEFHTN